MAIDRQGLIDEARQDPKFAPAIAQMEQRIANMPVTSDDLEDGIKLLEQMLEDSSNYDQIKASAIKEGLLAEGILPDQFDPIAIVALLVALYGLQEKVAQKGYARGGLKVAAKKLQRAGRGGDSMLAHINPREAEILRGMGASGRRNPATGLPEFKSDLGKILGAIAPIAINTFFPGIAQTIGNLVPGAGSALSSVIGNTVVGAATTALTGGKVLKGALAGANLGGLNEYIGGNLLGIQNPLMASLTGGALTGGAAGLINGNGMRGAVRGALGAGASALAKQSGNTAIQQAGKGFGSMIGAGFDPRMAMYAGAAGGLSGIAQNLMRGSPAAQLAAKPSEEVFRNPVTPQAAAPGAYTDPGSAGANAAAAAGATPPVPPAPPPPPPPPATSLTADDMLKYGMLGLAAMPLLNYMSGDDDSGKDAPKDAQTVLNNTLTEDQKRQMNMPLQNWDWTKINRDAAAAGLDANSYMAQHWDKFSSGYYNKPVAKARGGLSQVAYLAKGSGSGRADTINARLSDGEYVIDAETVALLGDGSVEHGAQRLDKMRAEIRRQKGRALAKGKISPNAKSPLAYLKGI